MDSSCSSRSSLVVRSVSSSFSIPVIVFEPAKNEKNSGKVENILKGSLNLISSPSPSVEIQIMGGKVCLRCKGLQKFVDNAQQCFAFKPRANFSMHDLNFH